MSSVQIASEAGVTLEWRKPADPQERTYFVFDVIRLGDGLSHAANVRSYRLKVDARRAFRRRVRRIKANAL